MMAGWSIKGTPINVNTRLLISGSDATNRALSPSESHGQMYRTSVDQIEAAAGLDFFNALPVALQAELEGGVDAGVVH
jgi:DNA/RNA endonuclease G (NUC1)